MLDDLFAPEEQAEISQLQAAILERKLHKALEAKVNQEQVIKLFTYHPPANDNVVHAHEDMRGLITGLVTLVSDILPESRERSLFITTMQEANSWVHCCIAQNQDKFVDYNREAVLQEALAAGFSALQKEEEGDGIEKVPCEVPVGEEAELTSDDPDGVAIPVADRGEEASRFA